MGAYAHGVFAVKRNARIAALVLALALAAGAMIWLWPDSTIQTQNKPPAQSGPTDGQRQAQKPQTEAIEATKDSDADGLKDWEEAIWRTDPKNPDSDGDKTSDSDEIAQNRNPLKRGPHDKVSALADDRSAGQTPGEESNLTYILTRNLLESGVLGAIDAQGEITSTDFLDRTTLPPNLDSAALLAASAVIGERELTLAAANDAAAIRQYFNALYDVYAKRIVPHQKRGDLIILAQYLQSGDAAALQELDPIIAAVGRAASDIRNIPVPPDLKSFAVGELNFLLKTKRAIEVFQKANTDPLAAALMVRPRIELFAHMAELHQKTKADLIQRGLLPSVTDRGYALFQ